jgi:TusA-related sulfurtransferase
VTPQQDERAVAIEVDAIGLSCPMPVIELAKAIDNVDVGDEVRLLATDPVAKVDVPVWCRMQRQRLRGQSEERGVWTFVVERAV